MKAKAAMVAGVTAVTLLASTVVLAQFKRPSPDQLAVRYRQALMTILAGNEGPLGAMGRGRMPYNAALVRKNSMRLAFLTTMIPDAFERNTSHVKARTLALPKIWQEKAQFLSHARKVRMAAAKLESDVKSGADEATIKMAMNHLDGACDACHMNFRKRFRRR